MTLNSSSQHTGTPVVCLVSLGCSKNQVDSEVILGRLAQAGFLIAEEPTHADVCLVNTCGFIQDAREESSGVLREMAALRSGGHGPVVVAMGCLVQRAADCPEMADFLRHADACVRFTEYPRLPDICRELLEQRHGKKAAMAAPTEDTLNYNTFLRAPRLRIGAPHTAYLKLGEGCANRCRFCSIPLIRGQQVSRPLADLVAEAAQLIRSGTREINLIAQDTTRYGYDLEGRFLLPDLLRALRDQDRSVWYRLLYAFPRHLSHEMLETLASDACFCPYLDLPLQHVADPMLTAMGRGHTKEDAVRLLDDIARLLPQGVIRTTFIVGYPGETESHFKELLDFVREGRFQHVGVFMYSSEPQTPAARLPDDVPPAEKELRRMALMDAQLDISRKRLAGRVGSVEDILVDSAIRQGPDVPRNAHYVARSRLEAPEVDGVFFLRTPSAHQLDPGDRLRARVVEALDYDVIAVPV